MLGIWKFQLEITNRTIISAMPKDAQPLTVQVQNDKPQLWVLLDPESEDDTEDMIIEIFGTGHPLSSLPRKYIGSFQALGGTFVGHVFYRLKVH